MWSTTFVLCLLWVSNFSKAADRSVVRQEIILHRLSRSTGRSDPFYSEEVAKKRFRRQTSSLFPSDDEDFGDDDGSGFGDSSEVDVIPENPLVPEQPATSATDWAWYRTMINFLDSIEYSDDLSDYRTDAFADLSDKIMIAVEDHLRQQLDGYHEATPLMFSMRGDDVMVMIDVGMCMVHSINDVTNALTSLVSAGSIGPFSVSEDGFTIRQIGVDHNRRECVPGPELPKTTIVAPTTGTTKVPSKTTTTESEPPAFDAVVTTTTTTPASTEAALCRLDQATCRNRQCIDRSYLCDGQQDCLDGSDEDTCENSLNQCDPTEFLCIGTGVCAQKVWRCDGDDDCGNGFDEQNCPTASPDAACESFQFKCRNVAVCIPSSYQCDGDPDCEDESDEDGCSAPVVVVPPERRITAAAGETVTIECEAVGVPTPIISWRVNWGNVPPPPRVTMTTVNGRGVLTIRKVKASDQGAYTCEAINSNGAIFGIPDAGLSVEDAPILPTEPTPLPTKPAVATTLSLSFTGAPTTTEQTPPDADVGSICPPGEYNTAAEDLPEECKPCYCFGITDQCRSSRLEFTEIGIEFNEPEDRHNVKLEPIDSIDGHPGTSEPITENQIDVNPPARELQLIDLSKRFLAAAHYWSLPAQFLGAKINSYGGTLTFSFSYNNSYHVPSIPTNHTDVILEGNGKTLIYDDEGPHPEPESKHTATVLLDETKWKTADGQQATRSDMLDVLSRLDRVLLRTVYDNSMLSSGIGDVRLQVAQPAASDSDDESITQPAGVIAHTVEECVCPEGYEGLSCEICTDGYERSLSGPLVGKCVRDSAAGRLCDVGYTGVDCKDCAEGYTPYNDECTRYPDTFCSVAGSIGIGLDEQCECKAGCEGPRCDKCKSGYYFLSEENTDGCLSCFCMGVTDSCNSTTWNRTTIQPGFRGTDYFVLTNAASRQTFQDHISFETVLDNAQPVVTSELNRLPNDVYFWMLPEEFIGNKLASYGGNLDYTINYSEDEGARAISGIANARLIGNNLALDYISDVHPRADSNTRYVVQIKEDYWFTEDGTPSTREELMMVLTDVQSFIVRATYSNRMRTTKIMDMYLDTAVARRTGRSQAYKVEQCECPPGYTGLSCEECAQGYHRVEGGSYLGTCEPCHCYGHSSDCDKATGICRNCRHDTIGDHCNRCDYGYYGDARSGNVDDCQRCPCPTVDSRTDQGTTATCRADIDGEPVCDQCPLGHEGNLCDRCAPGYIGDPLVPGSTCRQSDTTCNCDPVGSIDGTCDATGQCDCKPSTTGTKCDQCKPGFFYLSVENVDGGCLSCFCMGHTKQCTSATYKRNEITSDFARDFGGFALTQRARRSQVTTGFELLNVGRTLSYPRLDRLPRGGPYYWELPEEYRGDKIVSYGGKLQYKALYTTYGSGVPSSDADVILIGNDIMLMATVIGRNSRVRPSVTMDRSVVFREHYWRRADGQPATREHLLMALADVEAILIRATYSTSMLRTSISDVAMETASESVLMTEPAYEVEQCQCPDGYEGLSCEDCARGFTRSGSGIYLGLCHLCQCNGHAELCHSESGVCVNCQDNTSGPHCEQCATGYYGVATQGTSSDCQPCACPGTGENSFSDSCRYDPSTHSLQCTACQVGYAGQRCEVCAPGYEGSPTTPGGTCTRRETARPDVRSLPDVNVSPKRINSREGTSITLRCEVNSRSPATMAWTYVGSDSGSLPSDARVTSDGRALRFPRFSRAHAGTYQCTATNRYGSDSDTAVLTVAREKPMIRVQVEEPRQVRVRVGSQHSFVCTAESRGPAYIVSWTKKNGMLPLSRVTDFDGILHITNIQLSDSGMYICTGSNMYSTDRKSATLLVVGGNTIVMPTVVVTPNNQSVSEGEDAMFYCTARGFPTPNIEWSRADGKPMSDDIHVLGNMLMISSASVDDRTQYYCRASNPHGTAEATGALDVTKDGDPPVVRVHTPEVTLTAGDDADLTCTAIGDPLPEFSWSKRGQQLPANVIEHGGTLRITSASNENQGIYACTATNVFGEDNGYVRVIVNPKVTQSKPICRTEPKEVTAYVGTNSTITCVVGGEPLPDVTWETDDGSALDENIQVMGRKMFIHKVVHANAGKYVCVATNEAGVSRSKMTLFVVQKDLPKVVITPKRRQKVKSGQYASFTCLSPNEHDTDITWLRSDRQPFTGDTYLSNGNSKLNFRNISTKEAGSYLCVASNVVGHREAAVYIHVIQPPIIMVTPARYIDLTQGESIDLHCNVVGVPLPSVVWLNSTGGGSPRMLTNYRLRTNSYSIRNAKLSDAGDYLCRATNEAGNSQERVVLLVHAEIIPRSPSVTVESRSASGVVGGAVQIHCISSGKPTPSITWSKDEGELPQGSRQSEGILYIPNLSESDRGNYICTASNSAGQDTATVQLNIIAPPVISIKPSPNVVLVHGQSLDITCTAIVGTSPVTLSWIKESGATLNTVRSSGGRLQIVDFVPLRDVGTYICTATNQAGSASSTLTLEEAEAPVVNASPRDVTKLVGQSVEFDCAIVSGGDHFDIATQWQRVDGTSFDSDRVTVTGGVLSINNLQLDDATEYECTASNAAGTSTISTILYVHLLPEATLYISPDKETFTEGDDLSLTCNSTGVPQPNITLLKKGKRVDARPDGQFTIESLSPSDGGAYSCLASNEAGNSEIERNITVAAIPSVSIEQSTVEIRSGESLILNCLTEGSPYPNITWTKQSGTLPDDVIIEGGQLTIENAGVDDAGAYVCTSSNHAGSVSDNVDVDVNAFIPYFTQTPLSYLTFALPNYQFYTSFNVTISFRPNALDGLLFYSYGTINDFISLSLSGGIVEFRYDVGSGPVTIRSESSVERGQWHTVIASRMERKGELRLDDNDVIKGKSPGEFRALDLTSDLYIGGIPSDVFLPPQIEELGSDSGFYGCISQLRIGDRFIDVGSSDQVSMNGIVRCKTCGSDDEESPCHGDATCIESHHDKIGYECGCNEGYIGDSCQFEESQLCAAGSCGPQGTCEVDLGRLLGYICVCNSGYVGPRCHDVITTTPTTTPFNPMLDTLFARGGGEIIRPANLAIWPENAELPGHIVAPRERHASLTTTTTQQSTTAVSGAILFNQDSYMMSDVVKVSHPRRTDIQMRIRRRAHSDGLLLFSGGSSHRSSFISLSIRNNALEFRFNTGAGATILQTPSSALPVGSWHNIRATRRRGRARLEVDGRMVARVRPSGPEDLILDDTLYIGGARFWEQIPGKVNVRDGFDGCVDDLRIDDVDVPLNRDFTKKNTGTCNERTSTESNSGRVGSSVATSVKPRFSAKFAGASSYASFHKNTFPHDGVAEQTSLRFKTVEPNGLMLFHGEDLTSEDGSDHRRRSKDYISLGVKRSYLVFTYELGGGQGKATSTFPVSDGLWHTVTIVRRGSLALMWLDDLPIPVATQSPGMHKKLDVVGRVYVGGAPDVIYATGGRYVRSYRGCIANIRLTPISSARISELGASYLDDSGSAALDFSRSGTLERVNVRRCVRPHADRIK